MYGNMNVRHSEFSNEQDALQKVVEFKRV